jgi:3-oxoacyl-[acyl-carrier protein] reductase
VTGASRGIGLAIATRLAREGFDLTVSARTPATLDPVAAELGALAVAADMGVAEDVDRLADAHEAAFGRLDVLVISAGTGTVTPIEQTTTSRFDKQLAVNLRSPFQLVARLLPAMKATATRAPQHGAKVVAIASITGMASEPGMSVYGATKAGLISLCETINVEASAFGVSATAISPGYVDTDMTTWVHDQVPPASMITVDDIAELAVAITRLSARAVVPNVPVVRTGATLWRA